MTSALGVLRAKTAKASANLRGDLPKLSDAELAERLDAAWADLEAVQARVRQEWLFLSSWNIVYWRGPLRRPRAYRFLRLMNGTNGEWSVALIAWIFSGKQYERYLRKDPATDEYLTVCEVRDIMDEIARHLAQRRGSAN